MTLEDKAAISRAIQTLQERGYVACQPRGRNKIVKLTDEGQKFAKAISEKIRLAVRAGSVNITEEQRKFFYNSLLEISDNLIEYYQKLIESEDKK